MHKIHHLQNNVSNVKLDVKYVLQLQFALNVILD